MLLSTILAGAREPDAIIDSPYVGAGQAHNKHLAADDITAVNVSELEIVWKPNEVPLEEYGTRQSRFQATPIMVSNVLYLLPCIPAGLPSARRPAPSCGPSIPGPTKTAPRVPRRRPSKHRSVA